MTKENNKNGGLKGLDLDRQNLALKSTIELAADTLWLFIYFTLKCTSFGLLGRIILQTRTTRWANEFAPSQRILDSHLIKICQQT